MKEETVGSPPVLLASLKEEHLPFVTDTKRLDLQNVWTHQDNNTNETDVRRPLTSFCCSNASVDCIDFTTTLQHIVTQQHTRAAESVCNTELQPEGAGKRENTEGGGRKERRETAFYRRDTTEQPHDGDEDGTRRRGRNEDTRTERGHEDGTRRRGRNEETRTERGDEDGTRTERGDEEGTRTERGDEDGTRTERGDEDGTRTERGQNEDRSRS
ncbi:unnamed protein product [Pleuronectes platessa]|uniref:Uncharacterized protein n=1 Tax=Pleuronectes platessa TaxID=8262 RepID=A0A9N7UEC4_PLEPL|nr:unnamed protein product [Pleuronectes platessa]